MDLITRCSDLPYEQLCEEIHIAGRARKEALGRGATADVEVAESVLNWFLDELADRLRQGPHREARPRGEAVPQ
ncbi:hypothetical protein [Saccharopolyspora phatthalungensis]|uniref:Uncharacterized protein n=1 Tax=Saccharopolyspora phatthalungensis TaxID=664693 RepID=A0A840QB41_9PSEU|nr:hypothetical protein [Saccharopolyspora phatthalungensis]MBB5157636.1 hypothetical protein [Saccharopolyspora phatthalungensis]